MKTHRLPFYLTALILGSFLLSGCTGTLVNSYPGLSATEDKIYLAYQGAIYEINPDNGQSTCQFPQKSDPQKPFYAPPTVTDELIVAGNYGHVLYGLNPTCQEINDGGTIHRVFQQRWAFNTETDDPNKRVGNFSGPSLIVNDLVLAPSTNNRLYALSIDTGAIQWMFETGNTLWAAPVSDGTTVYLPALDHNLYALHLEDGKLIWQIDLGSAVTSAPVLADDGTLYVGALEGNLSAVNAADGSLIWSTPTGGRLWSSPVLHEGTLYVGNAGNKVTAISASDGSIVWQKEAGNPIIAGGVLLNDETIAFPTETGQLVGWTLDGETQSLNQTIGGKLYTTPVVVEDNAVIALMEGDKLLQAVSANGGLTWTFVQPK